MKYKIPKGIRKNTFGNPESVANIMRSILMLESKSDQAKEHFWGVYFSARQTIVRIELISLGTVDTSLVHPRECYGPAIESKASSWIAIHNHPSGNLEPSEADIVMTTRLLEAGKIMGIELMDHIIIVKDKKYCSFRERKLF